MMKTLSVGGRLAFIKSALGALLTYYMSVFKASKIVLNHLESLRNRISIGVDLEEKMTRVCWKKVMSQKNLVVSGLVDYLF